MPLFCCHYGRHFEFKGEKSRNVHGIYQYNNVYNALRPVSFHFVSNVKVLASLLLMYGISLKSMIFKVMPAILDAILNSYTTD